MIPTLPAHARIAAIIPCYSSAGDSTRIIALDGSMTILKTRIRAVIQRLAKSRAIDLVALRTNTRLATARKNLAPLPIAPGLVLVPLKIRKPRITGDITTGYVNLYAVCAVKANPHSPFQSTVTLSGLTELPVIWSLATVNRQLALARLSATPPATGLSPFTGTVRECFPGYAPELLTLAVKLMDVFNEILCIKQKQS